MNIYDYFRHFLNKNNYLCAIFDAIHIFVLTIKDERNYKDSRVA